MRYRGLARNEAGEHRWIYGLPSYGPDTETITEIGTPDGEFYNIDPKTLGEETEYTDIHGKHIYTGDITVLTVDGEKREFIVERATVDREYNVLPGFEGDIVKVRLSGVITFRWIDKEGKTHRLLPCVDPVGVCDCSLMEIAGTIYGKQEV